MPHVIAVVGPTASGKTALGVWLAKQLDTQVISCDSMQIYRRMDIGTAKPTVEEMDGVVHHMLDVCEPGEDFSVERYRAMATPIVDDLLSRGKTPILVGGTGLYLDGLLKGHDFAIRSTGWRETLQSRFDAQGIEPLWQELMEVDPDACARIAKADTKRVLRALEVWHETGETITAHNLRTQSIPPRYTALKLGLNFEDRRDLWKRIDLRVDEMERLGLVAEVERLLAEGVPMDSTAMQAIGYKEVARALQSGGSIRDALEEVKLRSRQYAKRQLTWFRRDSATAWYLHGKTPDMTALRRFATEKITEAGIQ